MVDVDELLGFCSLAWYVEDDMIDGGCWSNEGASHLCGRDREHDGWHKCQDCGVEETA